jgi:hypothetical protein
MDVRSNRRLGWKHVGFTLYLSFCVVGGVFVADGAMHPVRRSLHEDEIAGFRQVVQARKAVMTDVSIPTPDGVALKGWTIVPQRTNGDAVVVFHGLGDNRLELLGRKVWIVPAPIIFHRALAQVCGWTMKVPLVAKAQVRILSEGVVEAAGATDSLPADLLPKRHFTAAELRAGLPQPRSFGVRTSGAGGNHFHASSVRDRRIGVFSNSALAI